MRIDKPDDTAKRKNGGPRKHERPVDKRLMPKTAAEWARLLFAEHTPP
jgi:hypothetical protein